MNNYSHNNFTKEKTSSSNAVCEVVSINKAKVDRIKKIMKPERVITSLAEIFGALSDPTRVKIIFALLKEELCVCDLANLIGVSSSAISHQLRILRNLKIVKYRKDGKVAYYSLADKHIEDLFNQGLEHVEESP
ncbi:metalloregulator ArsR/SmtB family transcription factor [Candidatus Aminicenantes bacterium AC-335-A11]|jgi:DNA-binding transcriptional ArsR family regulator|nr:metalloregulator ArsR/SmtB family transcription factor [SCandidatus Aminicenantes bacterium Aminicenantia_JdfR_composite]MCP2597916.1 metalloregulator ArsR/SmtB family transcription factor [Candidatus Aminicenantes bacterium AC-335-L06]MCP2606101.1 metalloregulator ArsR/SmtB family transcription factor [Candidatus Aminicenantes bacterium AC-708-I09]MCP2618820.1 metalloregulator ArsR/SmtB family transcription factor [Candidatus Aminicenantes bacterium AC-335-A11]